MCCALVGCGNAVYALVRLELVAVCVIQSSQAIVCVFCVLKRVYLLAAHSQPRWMMTTHGGDMTLGKWQALGFPRVQRL